MKRICNGISQKGFTLIEVLVVIAILGVLVLLAMPFFSGYVEKAELARIQHDLRVAEQKVEELFEKNNETPDWEVASNDLQESGELYTRNGLIDTYSSSARIIPKNFIKDEVHSELKGEFYAFDTGDVMYRNVEVDIENLPVGSVVYDPSWTWNHKLENGSEEIKPVKWIVSSKENYDNSITLITKDVIGFYMFDNINNRWEDSHIRKFLNEEFYSSMSDSFKENVVLTNVISKETNANSYTTDDHVFLPSHTELGAGVAVGAYSIGNMWEHFGDDNGRMYSLNGKLTPYVTRTAHRDDDQHIRYVDIDGMMNNGPITDNYGIRPAINISLDTQVIKTNNGDYVLN